MNVNPSAFFQIMCFDVSLALQYLTPLILTTLLTFRNEHPSPFCFTFFSSAAILHHRQYLGFLTFVIICTMLLRSFPFLELSTCAFIAVAMFFIKVCVFVERRCLGWRSCRRTKFYVVPGTNSVEVKCRTRPRGLLNTPLKCEPSRQRVLMEHKISQIEATVPKSVRMKWWISKELKFMQESKLL